MWLFGGRFSTMETKARCIFLHCSPLQDSSPQERYKAVTLLFIGKVIEMIPQALCQCSSCLFPSLGTNPQGLAYKIHDWKKKCLCFSSSSFSQIWWLWAVLWHWKASWRHLLHLQIQGCLKILLIWIWTTSLQSLWLTSSPKVQ